MDDIHYEIILFWSKEDQTFIAEVPELSGCAADGATYHEAVGNVEVVIREWIETARELDDRFTSPLPVGFLLSPTRQRGLRIPR